MLVLSGRVAPTLSFLSSIARTPLVTRCEDDEEPVVREVIAGYIPPTVRRFHS